jgi:hypothetical protein
VWRTPYVRYEPRAQAAVVHGDTCSGRARLAALGTLRSGRVVADALTRHWWPLALAHPRTRLALFTKPPLALLDDLAYGAGVWAGCARHRTVDPLLPARPWKLVRRSL